MEFEPVHTRDVFVNSLNCGGYTCPLSFDLNLDQYYC